MFYASIFIYVLFYESRLKIVLSSSILRIFGVIGYSMYIWHLPIETYLMNTNFVSKVIGWNRYAHLFMLSVLIIIPFSFAMYVFVEKYFIDIAAKIKLIKYKNNINSYFNETASSK